MNFEPVDRTLFWEMGDWKDTLERWYQEGLPKHREATRGLKPGEGVRRVNAPHEDFFSDRRRDVDVHHYFGFDPGLVCLPVNSLLQPQFEKKIPEEDEDEELNSKVPLMLRLGGYVPHIDHHVHPDISWEDFVYYRTRPNEMILQKG